MSREAPQKYIDVELGRRITEARRDLGLTQLEVATRVGISLSLMEKLESGEANPTPYLDAIAQATNRPPRWFKRPNEEAAPDSALSANVDAQMSDLRQMVSQRLAELEGQLRDTRARLAAAEAELRAVDGRTFRIALPRKRAH